MNASTVLGLLQKLHRQLCLLLLILFGLACGQLAATVSGILLRPAVTVEPVDPSPREDARAQLSDRDLDRILANNIFDPNARGLHGASARATAADSNIKVVPRSKLSLVGTLAAGADSSALLMVDRKIGLYHLGESLPDGSYVEAIQRSQVTIRNRDKSLSVLSLSEDVQGTKPPRGTVPEQSAASDEAPVRAVGKNRWAVSEQAANAARTNIAEQLRLAQLEPRVVNGRTSGFMVRKLYPNSFLTDMGLRRGDVILRVNNMSLDTPEKALQVLQQLREARHLTVDLERRDQPMTFAYDIN